MSFRLTVNLWMIAFICLTITPIVSYVLWQDKKLQHELGVSRQLQDKLQQRERERTKEILRGR